jgi:hypothetical protein
MYSETVIGIRGDHHRRSPDGADSNDRLGRYEDDRSNGNGPDIPFSPSELGLRAGLLQVNCLGVEPRSIRLDIL